MLTVVFRDRVPTLDARQLVNGQIGLARSEIPESGVISEDGKTYTFINQGNEFRKTAIKTGLQKDGFIGENIVLSGAYYLNAELAVEEYNLFFRQICLLFN